MVRWIQSIEWSILQTRRNRFAPNSAVAYFACTIGEAPFVNTGVQLLLIARQHPKGYTTTTKYCTLFCVVLFSFRKYVFRRRLDFKTTQQMESIQFGTTSLQKKSNGKVQTRRLLDTAFEEQTPSPK